MSDDKKTNTEKIAEELDSTFKLISSIPVSGDFVDIMAEIRVKLRYAYRLSKEAENDG